MNVIQVRNVVIVIKILEYYKDKENKKVFRLLVCSNCVKLRKQKKSYLEQEMQIPQ